MKSLTKVFFAVLLAVTFAFGSFQLHANARTMADVDGEVTKAQSNTSILVGNWSNQLGSKMTITSVEEGNVQGSYETSVSASGCAKGTFPLVGRTNLPSLGFVVSWTNDLSKCSSVTAWSGQLQKDQIVTTWLLTAQTVASNNWRSTTVNQDVFTKDN
jgi:Avidin family.